VRSDRSWAADPAVTWGIALEARLTEPVDPALLDSRLTVLADEHPHLGPSPRVVMTDDPTGAVQRLASEPFAPGAPLVRVAVAPTGLVIAAHHAAVDGLGLLAVLAAATASAVSSDARGIGDRPAPGFLTGATRRLAEAALHPPTRVMASRKVRTVTGGDVVARREVAGAPRGTSRLVCAVTSAVQEWNTGRGGSSHGIVVAVGASRRDGVRPEPVDDSALFRVRDCERLDAAGVSAVLASAPPETTPGESGRSGPLVRAGVRLLAGRLGSTVLVSHLGAVHAPGVTDLAFYPVTGGPSTVSFGAATVAGRTVLTARGRDRDFSADDLAELLGAAERALSRR
jgi:hypothetical protein